MREDKEGERVQEISSCPNHSIFPGKGNEEIKKLGHTCDKGPQKQKPNTTHNSRSVSEPADTILSILAGTVISISKLP